MKLTYSTKGATYTLLGSKELSAVTIGVLKPLAFALGEHQPGIPVPARESIIKGIRK